MASNKSEESSAQGIDDLNMIFKELVVDAKELTKDLASSIRTHLFAEPISVLFALQFG